MRDLLCRVAIKANEAIRWIGNHTVNRYHVVNISSPENGYRHGYLERGQAMLYANFALLKDFIENESPYDPERWLVHCETGSDLYDEYARHADLKREADTLYAWWVYARPTALYNLDQMAENANYTKYEEPCIKTGDETEYRNAVKTFQDEADRLDKEDDDMLNRLLKIRHFMGS